MLGKALAISNTMSAMEYGKLPESTKFNVRRNLSLFLDRIFERNLIWRSNDDNILFFELLITSRYNNDNIRLFDIRLPLPP